MSTYEILYHRLVNDPQVLESEVNKDLEINRDFAIEDYLRDQSQRYFKWAAVAAIAEARAAKQKVLVKELLWPQARFAARVLIQKSGGKVTEAQLDDGAMQDEAYAEGQAKLIDLEEVASVLKAAAKAAEQRMEMLRSLNGRQRVELGNLGTSDIDVASGYSRRTVR